MSPSTKNIIAIFIVLLIVAAAVALFMARQSAASRQNGAMVMPATESTCAAT